MKLTKSQANAIEYLDNVASGRYFEGRELTVFNLELRETDYGVVWVGFDTMPKGRNHILLSEHWFVEVGKRGRLQAYCHPPSLDQFKGKKWLNIHIGR